MLTAVACATHYLEQVAGNVREGAGFVLVVEQHPNEVVERNCGTNHHAGLGHLKKNATFYHQRCS